MSCQKEKSRICELYSGEVGYAVGKINSSLNINGSERQNYSYWVDGVEFKGSRSVNTIGGGFPTGTFYMVIYEIGNPSNHELNMNYRINSDEDFEDFIEKYEDNPPPPSGANCE